MQQLLIITLVTKLFGGRVTNMEPFFTRTTLYHRTSACSGIRHEQYTCKLDESFTLAALLLLRVTGNPDRHCASKQCIKCFRICGCSKWSPPGCSPFASAVAKAMAKMPQSVDPHCIWVSMYFTVMAGLGVFVLLHTAFVVRIHLEEYNDT